MGFARDRLSGYVAVVVSRETAVCVLLGVAAGVLGSELGLQQLGVAGSALVGVLLTRMLEERIKRWRTSRVWLLTALFAAWEWLGKAMGGLRRALGLAGQGLQATATGAVVVSVGTATVISLGTLGAAGELDRPPTEDRAPAAARVDRGPIGAETLILPQRGIGGIELEQTRAQVVEVRGRPDSERVLTGELLGPQREVRYGGVSAVFSGTSPDSTVIAVSTSAAGDETPGGVGPTSSEADLRRRAPGVRCRTEEDFRHCWLGRFVPGGRVTDFSIGPPGRTVLEVMVAIVVD